MPEDSSQILREPIPVKRNGAVSMRDLPTTISPRFPRNILTREAGQDRITGLPIQNDEERGILIDNLRVALQNRAGFGCVIVDADQLKKVNDMFGKEVGDRFIEWTTVSTLDRIDKSGLRDNVKVIALKNSHAADETIVWFFGLDQLDAERIKNTMAELSPQEVEIDGKGSVEFSSSVGFVSSYDDNPELSPLITQGFSKPS